MTKLIERYIKELNKHRIVRRVLRDHNERFSYLGVLLHTWNPTLWKKEYGQLSSMLDDNGQTLTTYGKMDWYSYGDNNTLGEIPIAIAKELPDWWMVSKYDIRFENISLSDTNLPLPMLKVRLDLSLRNGKIGTIKEGYSVVGDIKPTLEMLDRIEFPDKDELFEQVING